MAGSAVNLGGQSWLSAADEAALCDWLEARFCRSTHEIRAYIATEFGIRYAHSGCIKLLARLGFEYRNQGRAVRR